MSIINDESSALIALAAHIHFLKRSLAVFDLPIELLLIALLKRKVALSVRLNVLNLGIRSDQTRALHYF